LLTVQKTVTHSKSVRVYSNSPLAYCGQRNFIWFKTRL